MGVKGRGREIPVLTEGTWKILEKDMALGVSLKGRIGRDILGTGSSCGPGTQLEIKRCVERGEKAIGWICHVAEAETARKNGPRLGAMLVG